MATQQPPNPQQTPTCTGNTDQQRLIARAKRRAKEYNTRNSMRETQDTLKDNQIAALRTELAQSQVALSQLTNQNNEMINRGEQLALLRDKRAEAQAELFQLKIENNVLGKQMAALQSELAQAQAQAAASSKRTSREPNPFTKLITHNCEVSVPLVSHDQIREDFLSFLEPELPDMHQKNNLLRFVLFGTKDTWFCFTDVCEKNPDDLKPLPGDIQDYSHYHNLNPPHNSSDCKFMIGKFKSRFKDRITLRGFRRPS